MRDIYEKMKNISRGKIGMQSQDIYDVIDKLIN